MHISPIEVDVREVVMQGQLNCISLQPMPSPDSCLKMVLNGLEMLDLIATRSQ